MKNYIIYTIEKGNAGNTVAIPEEKALQFEQYMLENQGQEIEYILNRFEAILLA